MKTIRTHDMAHGGEAVGRSDGKAVFVDGALPNETVEVEIVDDRDSWARAKLLSVVEPSPERIDPTCRHFGSCGGCQWQFADRPVQAQWKREVLEGQLRHLGRMEKAEIRPTVMPGSAFGYRNRMDFRVENGNPALYRRGTRDLESLEECPLLAPSLQEMLEEMGDLSPLHRVTVRVGVNTGERLAVVSGKPPERLNDWSFAVCRVRRGRVDPLKGAPFINETIRNTSFRVSASAFFQNNTAGAEELVDIVGEALAVTETDTLLDAYAGGGLFSLTVGRRAARRLAVETAGLALEDLAVNSRSAALDVEIVTTKVERGLPGDWTVVVCDPPRTGLGKEGVASITRPQPRTIAYVACDPASLARDARLLDAVGYELDYAIPVDMFPQTFHIETVARFQQR